MKQYDAYYDSELDTWVINNSNIEKGEFTENTKIVTVESLKEFFKYKYHHNLVEQLITGLEASKIINAGTFLKVKLVFDGWILGEGKTFDSKETIEASLGSFHGGTTFNADLYLRKDEIDDLKELEGK